MKTYYLTVVDDEGFELYGGRESAENANEAVIKFMKEKDVVIKSKYKIEIEELH